jgi:hypothetical protein
MPGREDQRPVAVDGPLVALRPVAVRVAGVVRIREAALASRAALDVEHRVGLAVLHVHPQRPGRLDRLGLGRARCDPVELVVDEHDLAVARAVVQHVVDRDDVARL